MSLYDPPHLEPRVYVPCTCGTKELYHHPSCATQDETHPAWDKARESVERNARYWFGPKGRK